MLTNESDKFPNAFLLFSVSTYITKICINREKREWRGRVGPGRGIKERK